ncbi:glycosyltransferase [Aliarcobacter butzleri]|uniref:Glycosyltransferase n=1 Tax=Aliarcobacter butzleri TaxID=28197 RepID=A0AAP4UZD8_9BACT|nr:glycosyltransferase [Aliarcobacter butzleri]MDN5053003.1 glycosyltransferase [Aliarcobacter butzleri]MDN5076013.1 glycosyltransferase [Aliarcobacter butzleri]MDN5117380.1 glycosyltransferase [Aliarcobacter butzleri]MDN5133250.1 glycosyltransferase [Aliarcobacter butzleri]NUW26522.1 glycosyltransferase family 1 protein [Aliarcobacter butzleri]
MIVFYNPQVDDFLAEPPHFSFLKRRALKKYGYIFNGILSENEIIEIYVDFTLSAFIPENIFSKLPLIFRKLIVKRELSKWIKDNKLENKIKINFNYNNSFENKILFAMSYKSMENYNESRINIINKFKKSIFHLSHYHISTKLKSKNLSLLKNVYLCGDSDITSNDYFKFYFSWYKKDFLIIPFYVQDRFICKKDFLERKDLAIATGSFHNLYEEKPVYKYKDYLDFYKQSTYHPIRKILYENKNKVNEFIDVKVSPYRENSNNNFLIKLFKKYFVNQKKYFAFDIVELYNQYKYVVVGEENIGFPAIGAFEAMACGCILIGQKEYYNSLGMEENIHYISYDGNLNDLIEKIKYLKNNLEFSEEISNNGRTIIKNLFSKNKCYKNFKYRIINEK